MSGKRSSADGIRPTGGSGSAATGDVVVDVVGAVGVVVVVIAVDAGVVVAFKLLSPPQ